MQAGKQQEVSFTTIAAPDTTAPTVNGSDPSNDATGVVIDKTIALTFSEEILVGGAYDQIGLKDGSNNAVTFTKNISGNTLTLDPVSDLGYNSSYTVTVPAGAIKDAAGNGLTSEYALTFTTGAAPIVDQSAASAALASPGPKTAGTSFAISITGAKDISGAFLNGSNTVTVTNGASVVYSGDVTFTAGVASVTIPASSTPNIITTAGTYTLTVAIAGVTPQPTVALTITAATQIDSTLSTAVIDQALSKGVTRTITVTLRDKFGNPIPNLTKNLRTNVIIANNNTLINESYFVDGATMTASGLTVSKAVTTNANGQYTVSVIMPDAIDSGDGVSVQIAQNNGTSFYGTPFTYYEPIPTPLLSSATADATHIVLVMDQPLLGTVADAGAFTIHGAATNPTVTNAVVAGTNVTLSLSAAIAYGETITLDYTKTGNNNLNNGPASQVANFTNQPVTNNAPEHAAAPVFVSAASNVQGNVITVTFDKEMAALPTAPDGFSVTVDGVNDVVTALANNTDKTKIELLLTTAINYGETVTLSYSPGTVTALDGGVLAGFTDQAVANNTIQDGYITTLLGDGTAGSTGDNGPAISARIAKTIFGCTVVDSMGNIYISDSSNGEVREIAAITHTQFGINMTAGNIYTVAGTGDTRWGYNVADEGKPATAVSIKNGANGIAVDASGNLYIADTYSNRIREVANTDHTQYGIAMTSGCIYSIAGVGDSTKYTTAAQEEGVAATTAHLAKPYALTFDTAGNLYIVDYNNYRIRKVDAGGIINTVAGTGDSTPTADSGPATSFNLRPETIAFDSTGNLFIGDGLCGRIYKMDTSGNITTYAGKLILNSSGSGYTWKDVGSAPPLTEVGFKPTHLVFDSADNLYVAEGNWNRVRKIGADGSVTLAAGFGYAAGVVNEFNGDNIPATIALLGGTPCAPLDSWGNMYILDNQLMRLRFVKNPQVIIVPSPVVSTAATVDETHIGLTMSRALLGTAVNPAAFTVSGAASNPTVTVAAISGTSVILTLSSAIAHNDTVTISYAKTGYDSAAGYSNLTAVENFSNLPVTNTIAAPPGTITVSSADPVDGATGVAIDKTVAITFSEAILAGDAYNQISIQDAGNNSVSFAKSISGSVLSLDPDANLAYSSTYTVTVPASAVKIAAGGGLTGAYTMSFTTEIQPDTSAPVWTSGSLTASNVTQTSLTLSWSGASDNVEVTGYNIYKNVSLIDTVSGASNTYNVTGLNPGTQYNFQLQAGDAAEKWSTDGPSTSVVTAVYRSSGTVLLSMPETTGKPGETRSIPVTISDGDGTAGFEFILNYDPALLSNVQINKGSLIAADTNWSVSSAVYANGLKVVGYNEQTNSLNNGTGELLTLTCTIGTNNQSGDVLNLNLNSLIVSDALGEEMPAEVSNGKITVVTRNKGDVNGDNVVNVLDVVKALNIALENIQPTSEERYAADANNDSQVNVLDVVRIVNIILGN